MPKKPKSRKPTYGSATNIAWILRTLYNLHHPIALEDIIDQLGISVKTAHRYLKVLNENLSNEEGDLFILVTRSGGRERWHLNIGGSTISSTAFQMVALVIGLRLMEMLSGTVVREGAEDIVDALKTKLSHAENRWVKNLDRKFYDTGFGQKSYQALDEQLDVLIRGLLKQFKVKIQYQRNKRKPKSYTLRPYSLLIHKGSLYLIAHVEDYGEIRTFRIENIVEAKLMKGEGFEYPTRYRPERTVQGGFGIFSGDQEDREEIVIEFDDGLHEYITLRDWHPTQRFSKPSKGKFNMTVTLDDTREFKSWAKSFIPEARVIKPKWLAEEIKEELEEALDSYES